MSTVYIGTSGYTYQDWKGTFYPTALAQSKWLKYYSERFNTVEINATFYRHFKRSVFERWNAQTGETFRFVIKGPRYITHLKKLIDIDESLDIFFESVSGLDRKVSVILWQFPRLFRYSDELMTRLETFLNILPTDYLYAFEFRDPSWFINDVFTMLGRHTSTHVLNDSGAFSASEVRVGSFTYIRFHGPGALYASSYSNSQLRAWAKKIKNYSAIGSVYCFFNNDIGGHAVKNAQTLEHLLKD